MVRRLTNLFEQKAGHFARGGADFLGNLAGLSNQGALDPHPKNISYALNCATAALKGK